jgi:hypothetical protein
VVSVTDPYSRNLGFLKRQSPSLQRTQPSSCLVTPFHMRMESNPTAETLCGLYIGTFAVFPSVRHTKYSDILQRVVLKVNRRFEGTCRLHFQGQRTFYFLYASFFLRLFFYPEDGSEIYLRNLGCLSTTYTALYLTNKNNSQASL